MQTVGASDLDVLRADDFYRLTEREFGMPGLVAIESVGPFVALAKLGPFITIHDSFMEPGLGIGHHPHRTNERLFYILEGRIEHDDALNGIRGTMYEGDLARLTEGVRGMLHQEWNGRDDVTTHAFILVYTPDVEPPIPFASFDALRAANRPRVVESPGVETLQLIGGRSSFRANNSAITSFFDTSLTDGGRLGVTMPPGEGLILYPIDGAVTLTTDGAGAHVLPATDADRAEGPGAIAVAWSDAAGRELEIQAGGPSRVIRIGFRRMGADDVLRHSPSRTR
ncbi:MAG: pirin family protein [Candidatus Limnocylindria bacterium]